MQWHNVVCLRRTSKEDFYDSAIWVERPDRFSRFSSTHFHFPCAVRAIIPQQLDIDPQTSSTWVFHNRWRGDRALRALLQERAPRQQSLAWLQGNMSMAGIHAMFDLSPSHGRLDDHPGAAQNLGASMAVVMDGDHDVHEGTDHHGLCGPPRSPGALLSGASSGQGSSPMIVAGVTGNHPKHDDTSTYKPILPTDPLQC